MRGSCPVTNRHHQSLGRGTVAVAGGPGKWSRPAERPRGSLLSFTATSELHVQVEPMGLAV